MPFWSRRSRDEQEPPKHRKHKHNTDDSPLEERAWVTSRAVAFGRRAQRRDEVPVLVTPDRSVQLDRVVRRVGSALIVLVVTGWSASTTRAALLPPSLPVRASPNSVASFPCPQNAISTVDMEACEGRRLLEVDREFNREAAVLWSILDGPGRRAFARAHDAWLAYRHHVCAVSARAYLGGTAAGVIAGHCQRALTAAWLKEVKSTVALYCQGKVRAGRFRRCPRS